MSHTEVKNVSRRIATTAIQTQNRMNLPIKVMETLNAKQGDDIDFWLENDGRIYIALPVPPDTQKVPAEASA